MKNGCNNVDRLKKGENMRKVKVFFAVFIGFILGALTSVGIYFLTVGEVAWKEYAETKLIPNAVLALTAIGGLATASLPIIAKVQTAVDKFNKATKDVSDTVEKGRKTEGALNEQDKRITEEFAVLNEKVASVERNTRKTKDMCTIGFCNMSELVKNGYAAEIAKVGEQDEEET